MKKKIEIDYTDWYEQVITEEDFVRGDEDVIKLLEEGKSTREISINVIVSREEGIVGNEFIRPNKLLLLSGAQRDILEKIKKEVETIENENGDKHTVRKYIAMKKGTGKGNGLEDELPETYQETISPLGLKLAINDLLGRVFRDMKSDLEKIYVNGEDPRDALDELMKKIEDFMKTLN
jgi:hypothetical protein